MNNQERKEELSALTIIQKIKDRQFDPKLLNKEMRQQCVEVLFGEGYSKNQMAQILKFSEKTIKRDIDNICLCNSLVPDENLQQKIVGQLKMVSSSTRERLMRLANRTDASVAEKIEAEYKAFKAFTEYIEKLQSLGYLPLQSGAISGDLSLRISNQGQASFEDLEKEAIEIEKTIETEGEMSPEKKKKIQSIMQSIDKAKIKYETKKLLSGKKEEENETNNQK